MKHSDCLVIIYGLYSLTYWCSAAVFPGELWSTDGSGWTTADNHPLTTSEKSATAWISGRHTEAITGQIIDSTISLAINQYTTKFDDLGAPSANTTIVYPENLATTPPPSDTDTHLTNVVSSMPELVDSPASNADSVEEEDSESATFRQSNRHTTAIYKSGGVDLATTGWTTETAVGNKEELGLIGATKATNATSEVTLTDENTQRSDNATSRTPLSATAPVISKPALSEGTKGTTVASTTSSSGSNISRTLSNEGTEKESSTISSVEATTVSVFSDPTRTTLGLIRQNESTVSGTNAADNNSQTAVRSIIISSLNNFTTTPLNTRESAQSETTPSFVDASEDFRISSEGRTSTEAAASAFEISFASASTTIFCLIISLSLRCFDAFYSRT